MHIETDIGKALDQARSAVDTVAAQQPPLTYTNTIAALDEGLESLNRAWGLVSHLDSVNNSPELRAAHNAMLPKVSEFFASIPLNESLWKTLRAYSVESRDEDLSPTKRRYIEETLADFREAGADLRNSFLACQNQRSTPPAKARSKRTQKVGVSPCRPPVTYPS